MDEPKTLPEQLDAAETAEEWGDVFMGFMGALDRARQAEEDA